MTVRVETPSTLEIQEGPITEPEAFKARGYWSLVFIRFWRDKLAVVSGVFIVLLFISAFVAAEADEDELPVAACLDHVRLSRGAERDLNRRRSVDAYRHDRGESISKHARLPPIRIQLDVPRPSEVSP